MLHIYTYVAKWVSPFTGLDYWTGIPDWTTGLEFFTFLGKFLYGFLVYFKIFDTWRPQFFLNHHRISVILQSTTS